MTRRSLAGVPLAIGAALLGCATAPPARQPAEVVVLPPPAPAAAPSIPSVENAVWPAARVARLRDTVHAVMAAAAADSAFPGAYAIIGTRGGILVRDSVGRIDWAANEPIPDARTIWDLASLTKVVGLTSAMIQLVAAGRVDIDQPVAKYLPEFGQSGKENVTVRQLLSHSGGMPSWRPLYKEGFSADSAIAIIMATPLDTTPGARMVYSDLGLIALGKLVERVTGQPLDRYLATRVFAPIGMTETIYNPPASLRPRIAPTEIDPWRQRHIRGEVHDENAFSLGGIAGHAGLFSTADDLARFSMMYLNDGRAGGTIVLDSAQIARFTAYQDSAFSNRGLGWQKKPAAQAGTRTSPESFGHTGFTGTSIWIDPVHDVFIVLLSNRVNPTRMNAKIGGVRARLADAVMSVVLPPQ